MNYRLIVRTLGFILLFEALFLIVPILTGIVYWEKETLYFLLTVGLCLALGFACLAVKVKNDALYAREGVVIVALAWIVMSIFGALPFT